MTNHPPIPILKVRIDRWLWAARLYKTRSNALKALNRGHISVNGKRAKPAKMLSPNDKLVIRKNQCVFELQVLTLAQKRVSAKIAETYYSESDQSMKARAQRQAQILANRETQIAGKPNKKDRRTRAKLKRQAQL